MRHGEGRSSHQSSLFVLGDLYRGGWSTCLGYRQVVGDMSCARFSHFFAIVAVDGWGPDETYDVV